MPKILLISHCVPPLPYGPSAIFKRLFRYFNQDEYVVLASDLKRCGFNKDSDGSLGCRYFYAKARTITEDHTAISSLKEWIEVIPIVMKGLSVARKEKITGILVHPTVGNMLLSAYIIHKVLGVHLFIYVLDLYSASQTYRLRKLMARIIEKKVMKSAETVFVMSEALQDYYRTRCGIETMLIRHPVALPETDDHEISTHDTRVKKRIVFTGMIYEAQLDALKNLVDAVNGIQDVELHIYSPRSEEKLRSLGLSGDNIFHHGFVEPEKVARIQREADILFLPMAFDSPYPDIIKTASPGKLPEYLASGTPILVHAPEYAYISWYARKYGWGRVVDTPSPELLKEAINEILNDGRLARRLVEKARETSKLHEESRVAAEFKKGLNLT